MIKFLAVTILIIIVVCAALLAEIYTQLARYQKYWDKVNAQPVKKDSLVYVAFGDSAAQGVGASKPQKGYVGLIAKDLADRTGKDVHVINLSKSGAKIQDVLTTQLPKYEKLGVDPKYITIEVGANDMLSFEPAKFEQEMDELMSRLPKQTIVSDLPSFAGSRLAKYEKNVLEANEIVVRLADTHGLKRALLYDNVAKNHGFYTFAADIFHPSNYGYKTNWAPAFLEQIQ